ncbi:hypothetical protein N665_4165s0001 [Sinapis alba]|nr:hypothetical protein N665_4165s0001 [Sinapis alba]
MIKDIGELSESEDEELVEPEQGDKGATEWTSFGEELEAVDPEVNQSQGRLGEQSELELNRDLTSCWTGPVTRSRSKAQREALLHLLQLVGNKSEGESQDKPACWQPATDNLGNLKLRIPPFHGKNDPDAYLEWEKKIELVFNCQQYTEERKVRIAATEFCGYAINWWEQIATTRRRNGEPQIASWFEMKTVMKKRFVPSHYGRDLHQRLRKLSQGSKSVEDYHQDLETLIMKAGVIEDAEATMARFQGGLNRDIQDRLELQEYEDMDELLHKAILIEQQNKRKSAPRTQYGTASKSSYSRDDKSFTKPKEEPTSMETRRDDKGKGPATTTRSRNVKCFKCQGSGHHANECTNKKVMIVLANEDVVSEDEKTDQESDEEGVEYPVQGEMLVTRRILNAQPKAREDDQRENLFHTRCLIQNKVCSLIIDGGAVQM